MAGGLSYFFFAFAAEVGGVVAGIAPQLPIVEFHNCVGYSIKEISIVGD